MRLFPKYNDTIDDCSVLIKPPSKKEFITMFQMLEDAEKYDNRGEKQCRDAILKGLEKYIHDFRAPNLNDSVKN